MIKPIIIDTCVLSKTFDKNNDGHKEFRPVLDALMRGKCTMLMGGTKYLGEVAKLKRLLTLINKMKRSSMIRRLDDQEVDMNQSRVEQLITHPDFDDPHLPAMAIVGNCHLICSDDERCMKHIKNRVLYPTHFRTPRFYSRVAHKKLLYDKW